MNKIVIKLTKEMKDINRKLERLMTDIKENTNK